MNNIEKNYKEILENKDSFAVNEETEEVLNCSECNCEECKFYCSNNGYEYDSCNEAKLAWLFEEYKEPLLTNDEKEYFRGLIKLFDFDKISVIKISNYLGAYLSVHADGGPLNTLFFDRSKLFKRLEPNKEYSLEDLGLDE